MKRLDRIRRGAATVEMAIAAVILVPTIMYTIFLEDLLNFKLEQYETISSPAWDYLSIDYNAPTTKGNIDGYARLTYCDHTSLYNSYDQPFECGDNHHNGTVTAAHQCWIVAGAKQVYCSTSKDDYLGSSGSLLGLSTFNSQYNEGGVFNCNARLGVMNFFLPNKFFTWSEKRNAGDKSYQVTTKNRYKSGDDNRQNDDAHGNAASGTGVDSAGSGDIILAQQNFSVLHDPWATNYPPNTDGDNSQGKFHDRMKVYYDAQGIMPGKGYLEGVQFGAQAVGDGVLGPMAIMDGDGDDPITPTVAWKSENTRNVNSHTASGWEDDRQQSSYGSREDNYFGMEEGWW